MRHAITQLFLGYALQRLAHAQSDLGEPDTEDGSMDHGSFELPTIGGWAGSPLFLAVAIPAAVLACCLISYLCLVCRRFNKEERDLELGELPADAVRAAKGPASPTALPTLLRTASDPSSPCKPTSDAAMALDGFGTGLEAASSPAVDVFV